MTNGQVVLIPDSIVLGTFSTKTPRPLFVAKAMNGKARGRRLCQEYAK